MRCHHFDSGACRSCTLLDLPRPRQLARGRERVEQLLAPHLAPGTVWGAPIVGAELRITGPGSYEETTYYAGANITAIDAA